MLATCKLELHSQVRVTLRQALVYHKFLAAAVTTCTQVHVMLATYRLSSGH